MQKTIHFKITGMHCASCVLNIEQTLTKNKGIHSASVNLALEKACVEYDADIIDPGKIKSIIDDLGYSVVESDSEIQMQGHEGHQHFSIKENDELNKAKKQFVYSLIFGLPLAYFALSMVLKYQIPNILSENSGIIQFILTTIVITLCRNIWKNGLKSIFRLNPDMDSLIFIGTAIAYFYSLFISVSKLLNIQIVSDSLYYDSAAFILIFISLGRYLESLSKGKTSEAIRKLMGLQAKEATVIKDKKELKIPISEVKIGDILLVKPGEKIPTDGVVVAGYSGVDEKNITGESIPVEKNKGDVVIGSTINKTGVLKIKTTKIGNDTMLAQIIKIVEDALSSKAKIQVLVDKIAYYFVPLVILIAGLSFLSWIILGQSFIFAMTIFVTVIIIACPCALGLATPTAVAMGTGLAAKNGILIKNVSTLEKAQNLNTVVFDKTGTITKGEPVVNKIIGISTDEKHVLAIAASLEKNSEHPLAQAILNKAKTENVELFKIKNFKVEPGKGVVGNHKDKQILIGTRKLISENNILLANVDALVTDFENEGMTVSIVAEDQKIIGIICMSDTLKEYSKDAVRELKELGKKIVIITGDNKLAGEAIAKEVGADEVLAEVLPQGKSQEISKLQEKGDIVAMVGDGINDAPALAQADIGIALGSGTDVAMETGEIVLIKDDLRDVVKAIKLSRYISKKIRQGLFWAFIYNIISIPIAAGILYPFTGWLLNPSIAALAMAFSSVSVVFNALTMKWYKP